MSNRIELGGFYPSKGEQSFGELRARFYVEYSNALSQKINEIWANNPDSFDNPREVLAAAVAGELDNELMKDNEVHPEEYDREEWVDAHSQTGDDSEESDESDDE